MTPSRQYDTNYEHLDELRRECGFRSCGWREYLLVARSLLPDAMESDRPLPLIEMALERLRTEGILAPNMIHVERLVWIVLKIAERRLLRTLTQSLSVEQRNRLDSLLYADASIRGATRLSWLRQAPGMTSPKSIKQLVERLLYLRELSLPALPITLHQNRVLQLARKCSKYQAQPLLNLPRDRRHALLVAYLFELSQDLTDQALDQFDKLLGELLRKGERSQEKHLRINSRKMNNHLTILTKAAEEFLLARTELMRKLAAYPRQNQVARALTEFGKLERTSFLLEYFRDATLRRPILIGLNKGEALHALARQLFFGRLGELRDRALEDQIHRASCLHLLMAAIAAWNTVYLTEAIATLRKRGEEIPEATVAHIAPLGWEHIRLIGDYHFAPQSGRSLENLRPLRLQEEEESA